MSAPEKKLSYSFDEFLAMEEKAEYKSEFFQGEIFAMSGGTMEHSIIATNITGELRNALRGQNCFVANSDLLVRVEASDSGFYPDAMVICGDPQLVNEKRTAVKNPTVIFEVLSESTAAWDHGGKFRQYRLLETLQEYVIVEQKEPQADVYRRGSDGIWLMESYSGLEESIALKSLQVTIPMREVFLGVDFQQG
jgi:Uma2 family endonuclease